VNGKEHPIRYQYTAVLDIIRALNDPDLEDKEKVYVCLFIMYEDFDEIDPKDYKEALEKAMEFIDNGETGKKNGAKLVDFEQDEKLLIPAINRVAGKEIRLEKDIHWWTFLGWFMEIGDCTYSQVLNIRSKRAKGKKLEDWEQEFYSANREMCDIKTKLSEEEKEAERRLNELLS
jgi:hypothetical protein